MMIKPEKLNPGDKVAIISPSSAVKSEYIDNACLFLREQGLVTLIMPHAKGPQCGSYAASRQERLSDFLNVWEDKSIKAVLCGRGGYGATHLLTDIPDNLLHDNPKWLIGFSDISALHAATAKQGIMSVHGPMTRNFNSDDPGVKEIMKIILEDKLPEYNVVRDNINATLPANRPGTAQGRLFGGNLAVLNGLAGTPFDMANRIAEEDSILFIEDIAEPIYKVERVLYRLLMQGVLNKIKGLIVGQFTEYRQSADHSSMESMIDSFLEVHEISDIPVVYDFPCGHIERNMPLVEGAETYLKVSATTTELTQYKPFSDCPATPPISLKKN